MKISLKHLTAALLCICAAALTVSCVTEEENKWEGTKLVVKDWPEGVSRVSLKPENSKWTLNLYEAKETMAYEYFTGNTVITIYYDRLSDNEYDNYFGYGIRTDSEKPFKVFINSEEAENEVPLAENTLGWETVQVNARTDYFRTSFNITGIKTVELTFENAPEKILNKDLRLSDETIYAYIDTSALLQNFKSVTVWEDPMSTGNLTELSHLGYRNNGIYVFNRYTPEFYVDLTVKENYYISADDFDADVPVDVTVDNKGTDFRHIKFTFKSPSAPYVDAGTVIKLSGGTITPYDVSDFAGKSLVFSENIPGVKDEIESATLTLTDNSSISAVSDPIVNLAGGRTFSLTIDKTSWRGTWVATGFDIENRPVIKLYAPAVGDDGQSFEAELVYYNGQLNDTPGPCWSFSAKTDEFYYFFIFKLA